MLSQSYIGNKNDFDIISLQIQQSTNAITRKNKINFFFAIKLRCIDAR